MDDETIRRLFAEQQDRYFRNAETVTVQLVELRGRAEAAEQRLADIEPLLGHVQDMATRAFLRTSPETMAALDRVDAVLGLFPKPPNKP